MLTQGDDFPLHQAPEPVAFAGTDRNFYDRYFFNGSRADCSGFLAVAFGVYPQLNVCDAHISVLRDGVQHCLHASRILGHERMDLRCGPISIEVIEPLKSLCLRIDGEGWKGELTCEGRSFPIQEPRFTRRDGSRVIMDFTRFTQAMRWTGWLEIDGVREEYGPGSVGVRDRSWGVRDVGAKDTQPPVPKTERQFYWLWSPTNFPNLALYYHVNEDASGAPWNSRCLLAMDGARQGETFELHSPRMTMTWRPGTRFADKMVLDVKDPSGRDHRVTWEPVAEFHMKGIGYVSRDWRHGEYKGPLVVAREHFRPADLNPLEAVNIHIEAICRARHEGGGASSEGVGTFEQLVVGPHAPSGFKSFLDGAP